MQKSNSIFAGEAWTVFFARVILGLIFLMAGWYKVFELGAANHAQQLFVKSYASYWMPEWLLWITGYIIPFIELTAGLFLVIGLRIKTAAIALGGVLILVTYGHLLQEPFFDTTTHVFPRTVLLLIILYLSPKHDTLSVDYQIIQRTNKMKED